MKKLMLLGGIRYLLPVIKAAHEQGYHVITADYLPNNVAHKYSDEYANVSIIDKEAVLKVAQDRRIDGIMSFGVDPGVLSASYVQNRLGLPSFGPFESVEILHNKDRFRAFLAQNGFNTPLAQSFDSVDAAIDAAKSFPFPLIVKPTDSAGSKGVTKVDHIDHLRPALEKAISYSFSHRIIMEEYIEQRGCSSDSDSMSVEGKMVFTTFNSQYFDTGAANPFVPTAFCWPSTYTQQEENILASEIQRLVTLLGLNTAVYNIETRIGTNGKPYIMELTPRGGGNRLCEMLRFATGVDLITAITRFAVGDPIVPPIVQKPYRGHWAEIILHANREGRFEGVSIDKNLPAVVVDQDLLVHKGGRIHPLNGANNSIGTLVLQFDSADEMTYAIQNQAQWLEVLVSEEITHTPSITHNPSITYNP